MKPRTRIQKEVVRLSSGLPELTDKQKAYAFEHCFKHHAYRTKGGTITCSECGHRWKGGHTLAETICGCSCPHCGKELEMWIAPNGKTEVIARLRAMHTMYYDLWTEWSDMDLRSNKMLKAYNIDAYKTYPAMRIIPELKRNGFKGAFHKLTPYEFFTAILTDSNNWNSIKICIRNGYHIADASMWCDLVRLLRHFGKDTHCPKYICPTDLKKAHDRLVRKREEQIERERAEQRREQLVKDEKNYLKSKVCNSNTEYHDRIISLVESNAELIRKRMSA